MKIISIAILTLGFLSICKETNYDLGFTLPSKEEVILKTIENIKNGEEENLEKLLLSRKEHNEMFWNHVGEKFTSDKGMSADLAYDFMSTETKIAHKELSKLLRGKEFSISKVQCTRTPEQYGPFTLHLGCSFRLRWQNETEEIVTGIRSVLEYKNRFKLYHLKRE